MTTDTRSYRRLYTAEQMEAARAAWETGHFSDEWRDWRHLAAMEAGIIAAPEGTEWDQWDDDEPSQRAMLIRAIRETPDLLRAAIRAPGVHSWAAVIAILVRGRDDMREQLALRARDDDRHRATDPTHDEARAALVAIGWTRSA